MSIMDFAEPKEKPEPNLRKGQRVYRLVLDVIETGTITELWECDNKYGYRTDEDTIVFWDDNLNRNVFTNKGEAYERASSLKATYKVIRKKDMEVIKERNFIEICDDSRILISATVKLLKGNMVYWSNFYTYHFLEKFKTEKDAEKKYNAELNENLKALDRPKRFEVNLPLELKDMYLCQSGIWSEYEYAKRNGAVKKGELCKIK